jgi:predicted RNA-binding protein with PUA domain
MKILIRGGRRMSEIDQYIDIEYQKTNREKRQSPKSGKWWCDHCDLILVSVGAKCPKCGHIQGGVKKVVLKKKLIHNRYLNGYKNRRCS